MKSVGPPATSITHPLIHNAQNPHAATAATDHQNQKPKAFRR